MNTLTLRHGRTVMQNLGFTAAAAVMILMSQAIFVELPSIRRYLRTAARSPLRQ